jgi:MFS family permease
VSFLAVIASLLAIDLPPLRGAPVPSSVGANLREWFGFVAGQAPVRALLLMIGVLSVAGMPFTVLMPIFADQVLHGGPRALGVLMSASGVGALAGALSLAARRDVRGLGRLVAIAACSFGATLILFAISRTFALSTGILVVVGSAMMLQMGATNTLLQTMTPDALRGRVMAVYSMMLLGVAPLGALLAGFAAGWIGAPATVAIGGALCVLSGMAFATRIPHLRVQARSLLDARPDFDGVPVPAGSSAPASPGEAGAADDEHDAF